MKLAKANHKNETICPDELRNDESRNRAKDISLQALRRYDFLFVPLFPSLYQSFNVSLPSSSLYETHTVSLSLSLFFFLPTMPPYLMGKKPITALRWTSLIAGIDPAWALWRTLCLSIFLEMFGWRILEDFSKMNNTDVY